MESLENSRTAFLDIVRKKNNACKEIRISLGIDAAATPNTHIHPWRSAMQASSRPRDTLADQPFGTLGPGPSPRFSLSWPGRAQGARGTPRRSHSLAHSFSRVEQIVCLGKVAGRHWRASAGVFCTRRRNLAVARQFSSLGMHDSRWGQKASGGRCLVGFFLSGEGSVGQRGRPLPLLSADRASTQLWCFIPRGRARDVCVQTRAKGGQRRFGKEG